MEGRVVLVNGIWRVIYSEGSWGEKEGDMKVLLAYKLDPHHSF